MTSNEKIQNYKIVDLVESYNFRIKLISIRVRMKKDMIFLKSDLVTPGLILEKSYLFHTKSDGDEFYTKIVALNEIYNFVVLNFFHLKSLRWLNN